MSVLTVWFDFCCHHTLSPFSFSFSFSFPLTDAPKIANKPDSPTIRLTSGASQTITVRYDQGDPPATVSWSKDGQPINIPNPRIATTDGETKLTLINDNPSVRGTYRLKVYNGVGNGDIAAYTVEAECELLYKVDQSGYSFLLCEHLCVRFHILLIGFREPLGNVTTVYQRVSIIYAILIKQKPYNFTTNTLKAYLSA